MLTTPMKIILAIIAMALVTAGFYILDWRQSFEELAQARQQIDQRRVELDAAHKAIAALPELTREVDKLEAQLHGLLTTSSGEDPQSFVANYLQDIERLVLAQTTASGDDSFNILSISPGAAADSAANGTAPSHGAEALHSLPSRVFSMQMTGRYDTLTGFLDQLGQLKLDRLVTINRISLSPQAGQPGVSPVLSVTIPITAYLRAGSGG